MGYYTLENCSKIFNAIEEPQWRVWKILDADGVCHQNKRMINSPSKLLQFIESCESCEKLYVSASTFLNPHKNHGYFANQKRVSRSGRYFYPRVGYVTADCILLDTYLFIDIDYEKDILVAQQEARTIIQLLQTINYLNLYSIQYSGNKGIHLIYKMSKFQIESPTTRMEYYKAVKKLIAYKVRGLNLRTMDKHHITIMHDMFRVYAAPFSIKPNGHIVQPIPPQDFMTQELYSLVPISSPGSRTNDSAMEAKANDEEVASQLYEGGQRDGLSSHLFSYTFTWNYVKGARNNYVTVIQWNKAKFSQERLEQIQRIYKLSEFYVFSLRESVYCYNFKAVQFERLRKILLKARSENFSFFLSRRKIPILLAKEMEYEGCIKSDKALQDNHSKPHCDIFGISHENLIGTENNIGRINIKVTE